MNKNDELKTPIYRQFNPMRNEVLINFRIMACLCTQPFGMSNHHACCTKKTVPISVKAMNCESTSQMLETRFYLTVIQEKVMYPTRINLRNNLLR